MRILKHIALLVACLTMLIAIIARLFFPDKVFLGLAAVSYLRLTVVMLLFSLVFHFVLGTHKE
jgi:hypothetical protein